MEIKYILFNTFFSTGITINIKGRVVNGTDALEGEFPFVVSLRYTIYNSHQCGGTIISPYYILTAAHCVPASNASNYNIQFGDANINAEADSLNLEDVIEVIPHEGYNPDNQYEHDIALMRLKNPLYFSRTISSIELPKQGEPIASGLSATLVGWGLNATDGLVQDRLQKVDLKTYAAGDCQKLHRKKIHATSICAGAPEGGMGQCNVWLCKYSKTLYIFTNIFAILVYRETLVDH